MTRSARTTVSLYVWLLFVCGVSSPVVAQEEVPIKRAQIAILPFVYETAEKPEIAGVLPDAAIRYIDHDERELANVLQSEELGRIARANPLYAERMQVAREWMSLGIKNYQQLDIVGSIPSLVRGLDNFDQYGHAFVAPTEVAELMMYLALASLESRSSDVAFALEKFQQMILLDPSREIQTGVYPQQVVQFYRSARVSLEKSIDETGLSNLDLVKEAAALSGADYVLTFSLLANPNGPGDVVMGIYDARENRALDPIRMRAPAVDQETLSEIGSRLMSQFITCLEEPAPPDDRPLTPSTGSGRWAMQLNFTYMSFFEFPGPPDLTPFGNAGGAVGISYFMTREFALRTSVEVLTSIRDKNAALNESFQTLRGFAGGELGFSFGPVRLAIGANLEAVFLPEVRICIPADYRSRFENCPEFISGDRFGAFGGLNIRPRVSFNANQSIELFAGASSSFYVLPLSKGTVNFPTSADTGFQYRF